MKYATGLRLSATAGAALLLAAGAAAPAGAQTRSATIQAGLRGLYDSNVGRGSAQVATIRGLDRQDDFIYSPSLSGDISNPLGRGSVYLNGSIGYEFHQYNKQLDSERIGLNGGVRGEVGPCGGTIGGQFGRGQSNLSDLDLSVTQNVQQTVSASADLLCASQGGLGVVLGGSTSRQTNSASSRAVNSTTNSAYVGVSHTSEAVGTVSLRANYSKLNNDTPRLFPGVPLQGFENTGVGLSIQRPIGARLTGQASINFSNVASDGVNPGYTGVAGSGDLRYVVGPRLQMTLGYERSAAPSLQAGYNYQLQSTVRFGADYTLGPKIKTNLALSYSDRSYRGQVATPILAQIASDNTFIAALGASFQVGRRISLGLTGGWEDRNANLPQFDYTAYRIGLTATTILFGN